MRLRRLTALLACALLVAACASDPSPAPGEDAATTTSAPAAEAPPATTAPGDAPAPPDGGPAPGGPGSPGATTAPGDPAPTTSAPAGMPAPATGGVGAYAAFYLRPAESASVLVEVLAQPGAEPRPATVSRVVEVLARVSGKQVTTSVASLPGGAREWSAAEIRELADSVGVPQSRDRAVVRLLFLDGGFVENERAVGVAVRSDVAAVFRARVNEAAGALGSRAAIEEAVTVHEVGHLLGLVDLVLDTGRADPEHPGHSPNRESVMYYAVESTLIGSVLTGGPPREFDLDDLEDLARIRNG